MAIPTWVVGQVLTADDVNNWLVPMAVRKPSDEPVTSSTVLQADNDLLLALPASSVWDVSCCLLYDGGTTGSSDFKWQWTVPAGATIAAGYTHNFFSGASLVMSANNFTAGTTQASGTNGAGNLLPVLIRMSVVISSTPGNLQLNWAQNTSSGTATKVRTGSTLLAQRTG